METYLLRKMDDAVRAFGRHYVKKNNLVNHGNPEANPRLRFQILLGGGSSVELRNVGEREVDLVPNRNVDDRCRWRLSLLRSAISAGGRLNLAGLVAEEIPLTDSQKIGRFLRRFPPTHNGKLIPVGELNKLTGDEFINILQFVFGLVKPGLEWNSRNNNRNNRERIRYLMEVRKHHFAAVPGLFLKDYLTNAMAPHARIQNFKFLAKLCEYADKQLNRNPQQ